METPLDSSDVTVASTLRAFHKPKAAVPAERLRLKLQLKTFHVGLFLLKLSCSDEKDKAAAPGDPDTSRGERPTV